MGTQVIKKYRDVFGTTKKFNFIRENKFLIEDFYLNKCFKGNKQALALYTLEKPSQEK